MLGHDDARRVAEHSGPILQGGWRGLPAAGQARLEEHAGVGSGREDGDRRHGPESGRVEREVRLPGRFQDDIVRVLILRNDFGDGARRGLLAGPGEDVRQRA